MVIEEITVRDEDGKNDWEVVVRITDGEFKGAPLWSYVHQGEASRWKLREFLDALGLPPKGKTDLDKQIGKKIRGKVVAGTYEGEYRGKLGRFLPPEGETQTDDDAPPVDDDEPTTGGAGEDYSAWDIDELKSEAED